MIFSQEEANPKKKNGEILQRGKNNGQDSRGCGEL